MRTIEKRNLLSKERRLFQIWKNSFELNYNTRPREQRASETEEERKERMKERNEKDRERQRQRGSNLAVLKQFKRPAESAEKRAARLKQQEIFIPRWHYNRFFIIYLSIKLLLAQKCSILVRLLGERSKPHTKEYN